MLRHIVLASLLAAGCSSWRAMPTNHRVALTSAWAVTSAVVVLDLCTTIDASNGGKWDRMTRPGFMLAEVNPMLGSAPSMTTLGVATASTLVINAAVLLLPLPRWIQYSWFGAVGVADSAVVAGNYGVGARCP